ncbi:MAG: M56 family metallopeptidase, partial [Planctomycetota bacterium]|nr:M56 family metallopeptidase [Planctomycetota bacterium]
VDDSPPELNSELGQEYVPGAEHAGVDSGLMQNIAANLHGIPDEVQRRKATSLWQDSIAMVLRKILATGPWAMSLMIMVSILLLGLSIRQLRYALRGRRHIDDPRTINIFKGLLERSGAGPRVLLTSSDRLTTPVAMGVFRKEICLPIQALESLSDPELESMLAHELAHLVRHDPLWVLIAQALTTLLFIQPLNFVVRKQLREIAEYQCDAWAAKQCDDALPLARCLTEVASWMIQARRENGTRLVSGMSVHQSTLSRRVGRLLYEEPPLFDSQRQNIIKVGLAFGMGAMAVLAPGVQAVNEAGGSHDATSVDEALPLFAEFPLVADPMGFVMPVPTQEKVDPLEALDVELNLLEREVAQLFQSIQGTPLEEELQPLINEFERSVSSIRARRQRLVQALETQYSNPPQPVQKR